MWYDWSILGREKTHINNTNNYKLHNDLNLCQNRLKKLLSAVLLSVHLLYNTVSNTKFTFKIEKIIEN